jgi:hypothetical protein
MMSLPTAAVGNEQSQKKRVFVVRVNADDLAHDEKKCGL